jgi:hypothetical protein
MGCGEITDLHFLVATNSLSTPFSEQEEPFRKRQAEEQSFCGSGQRPHKRHSMSLGYFVLVPIPAHIDTEA